MLRRSGLCNCKCWTFFGDSWEASSDQVEQAFGIWHGQHLSGDCVFPAKESNTLTHCRNTKKKPPPQQRENSNSKHKRTSTHPHTSAAAAAKTKSILLTSTKSKSKHVAPSGRDFKKESNAPRSAGGKEAAAAAARKNHSHRTAPPNRRALLQDGAASC